MDVEEKVGPLRLYHLVKTNCERLVDRPVTWVYFGSFSHIVKVELSGKISVKVDAVLVFPYT